MNFGGDGNDILFGDQSILTVLMDRVSPEVYSG